jgi:LysM repeat protein
MLAILFLWQRVNTSSSPTFTLTPTLLTIENTESPSVTLTAAPPVTPETLLYTVQAGDTLGAIAQAYAVSLEHLMSANGITDPNLLRVGQTLIIPVHPPLTPTAGPPAETSPEPAPTGEPLSTPLPTLTRSGPPLVEIGQVLGSGDLAAEVVVIRNRGGAVSLEGWTLSDAEGNAFTFPTITLFADTQMRVHSTGGRSTPSDLYWGRETPAWNGGELITLRDSTGDVVNTYIVP